MSLIVRSTHSVASSRRRVERARQFLEEAHAALLVVMAAAAENPLIYLVNAREVMMLDVVVVASTACLRRARRVVVRRVLGHRHLVTRYLAGHGRFALLSAELVVRIVDLACPVG